MITWIDNNNVLTTSSITIDYCITTTAVDASFINPASVYLLSPGVLTTGEVYSYLSDSDHLEADESYIATFITTNTTDNFSAITTTYTTGTTSIYVASQTASNDISSYKIYATNGFVVKSGPTSGYLGENETWITSYSINPKINIATNWFSTESITFGSYYDTDATFAPGESTTIVTFSPPPIYTEIIETLTKTIPCIDNAGIDDGIYQVNETGYYNRKGGMFACLLHTTYQELNSITTYEKITPTIMPGTDDGLTYIMQINEELYWNNTWSTAKPDGSWISQYTDARSYVQWFFEYYITGETDKSFELNFNYGSPQCWDCGFSITRDSIESNWVFYNSTDITRVADFVLPLKNSGYGNMDAIPMAYYKNGYAFAPITFNEVSIYGWAIPNEHSVKIDGCNISWKTIADTTTTNTSSTIETANNISFSNTTQDVGLGPVLCLVDSATATFTYQGQVGMKIYNGSTSTTQFISGETDISPPIGNYPTSTSYINIDKNDLIVIGNEGFFWAPDSYTAFIEKISGVTKGYYQVAPILTFKQ